MRAAYGAGQMWAGLILATAAALLAPQWRVRVSAEAGVAARAPACPQAPAQAPSQAMLHAGFGPWPLRLRGGADSEEDLFADNGEEDEAAAAAIKAKAAAAQEKAKGDKPPAKTNIVLDVKGWGEETDMAELEKCVREIEMEGLLWGAAGLEDVGFGIKKLRITCVVEDDKVSVDALEEQITNLEDLVQSVDIAAMNKI